MTLDWLHAILWALGILIALALTGVALFVASVVIMLLLPDAANVTPADSPPDPPHTDPPVDTRADRPLDSLLPPPPPPVSVMPVVPAEAFFALSGDEIERAADVAIRLQHSPRDPWGNHRDPVTSPRWRNANAAYLEDDLTWWDKQHERPYWRDAQDSDGCPFYAPPTEPRLRPTRWGYVRDPQDAWADPFLPGYDANYDATCADRVDWLDDGQDGQDGLGG